MKYYLSSYKLGDYGRKLAQMSEVLPEKVRGRIAIIDNAVDYSDDLKYRAESLQRAKKYLRDIGLKPEALDLRDFFSKKDQLQSRLAEYGLLWVRGGNCFVLRQAMKLSGFDIIFKENLSKRSDLIYAGYSAGICVLAPSLRGLELVDDVNKKPYPELQQTIWQGLGYFCYCFAPHYQSVHPESAAIDKVIQYYINHKVLFKALKDGEVLVKQED